MLIGLLKECCLSVACPRFTAWEGLSRGRCGMMGFAKLGHRLYIYFTILALPLSHTLFHSQFSLLSLARILLII